MSQLEQPPPAAFALWRLRRYVTACSVIMVLALVTQLFVWAMVAFTDVRYEVVETPVIETAAVIIADDQPRPRMVQVPGAEPPPAPVVPEPVRVRSACDHLFEDCTGVALGAGTIAVTVLLMLVGLTTIIMSSAALPGVDKVVSAWIWTILVAVVSLPLDDLLQLPWPSSALRPYEVITDLAERENLDYTILAQLGLCVAGTILLLVRFRGGVARSLPPDPSRLDPHLEKEVANMKVTTLHGGRSAAALHAVIRSGETAADREKPEVPAATAVSPGERPRRLI